MSIWADLAQACASAYEATASSAPRGGRDYLLEREIANHKAAVAAEKVVVLKEARTGTYLLAALVLVAIYGLGQLCGVLP